MTDSQWPSDKATENLRYQAQKVQEVAKVYNKGSLETL